MAALMTSKALLKRLTGNELFQEPGELYSMYGDIRHRRAEEADVAGYQIKKEFCGTFGDKFAVPGLLPASK